MEAITGPFWPSSLLLHYHFLSCCTYDLLVLSDFDVCFGMEIKIDMIKGVLHPDTKISMFCLFSPSSRRKSILFMYGCDRCV